MKRRRFLLSSLSACAAPAYSTQHIPKNQNELFQISLAQWSNHRALQAGEFTNLEWPARTKKEHDILGLEYVNVFFKDKVRDQAYLTDLRNRVDDLGMTNVLIMIDGEGHLGALTEEARQKTVDNHKKWVDAAKFLGCHSIRVNSHGEGENDEQKAMNCVKGLTALSTYGKDQDINIIVENHGGLSSNGTWMAKVLKEVGMQNCGSLPDFGNFWEYDRYKGLEELMPFAKGVSAKSHDFDKNGNETRTDYRKALKIVMEHSYQGWIGVEYEGDQVGEDKGIQLTKKLLETIRDEMS